MCGSMMIHITTDSVTCVDEQENGENVFLLETQGMNLGQAVVSAGGNGKVCVALSILMQSQANFV